MSGESIIMNFNKIKSLFGVKERQKQPILNEIDEYTILQLTEKIVSYESIDNCKCNIAVRLDEATNYYIVDVSNIIIPFVKELHRQNYIIENLIKEINSLKQKEI